MSVAAKWTVTLLSAVVVFGATLAIGYVVADEFTPPVTALAAVLASAAVAIGGASVARQRALERKAPQAPGGISLDGNATMKGKGNAVVGNVVHGDLAPPDRRKSGKKKPSA